MTAHVAAGQGPPLGEVAGGTSSLDRGVYSSVQATRGKAHYEAFCATCHLGDLSGSLAADTGAPPLRGAPFLASMAKTGVPSFFNHLRATMPADDPGTLKDADYLEVLTYLFEVNGFPPGRDELTLAELSRLRVPNPTR